MNKLKIAIVTINQPSLTAACNLVPYLYDYNVDVFGKKDGNKSTLEKYKFKSFLIVRNHS